MADLQLKKGATAPTSFQVAAYQNNAPSIGIANLLRLKFISIDNGNVFDWSTQTFRANPSVNSAGMSALPNAPYIYQLIHNCGDFPRGNFTAEVTNTSNSDRWLIPFSVGLSDSSGIGYAATYEANLLKMAVWLEEAGLCVEDTSRISDVKILSRNGTVVWESSVGYTGTNGLFELNIPASLSNNTAYVFQCTAHLPGIRTVEDYNYTFKIGMYRP